VWTDAAAGRSEPWPAEVLQRLAGIFR